MGNSLFTLLFSAGQHRILVSGEALAYLSGDLEYTGDHIFSRAVGLLIKKRPFFVFPASDPAASIASLTGCDARPLPALRMSNQCVVVVTANAHGIAAVFRVGGCAAARAEVLRQSGGLEIAAGDPRLQHLVPRLLARDTVAKGLQISVETVVPGTTAEFSWTRVDAIKELWSAGASTATVPGRPNLSHELAELSDALLAHHGSLSSVGERLLEWHSRTRMPGGLSHGDLWLGNVLFKDNEITGIVDWEWAQPDGLPLVDLLHLLLVSYSVLHQTSISHSLRRLFADDFDDPALKQRLADLRRHFALDSDDLKFAGLLLWFDYLHQRAIRGRMPAISWTEDMIPSTVPVIEKWLARHRRRIA